MMLAFELCILENFGLNNKKLIRWPFGFPLSLQRCDQAEQYFIGVCDVSLWFVC